MHLGFAALFRDMKNIPESASVERILDEILIRFRPHGTGTILQIVVVFAEGVFHANLHAREFFESEEIRSFAECFVIVGKGVEKRLSRLARVVEHVEIDGFDPKRFVVFEVVQRVDDDWLRLQRQLRKHVAAKQALQQETKRHPEQE